MEAPCKQPRAKRCLQRSVHLLRLTRLCLKPTKASRTAVSYPSAIADRRELKVFKELAVPAAEPKLGNKQHWLLLEYLCAPESSVETAAVPTSTTL
jgi:hypothetical protein